MQCRLRDAWWRTASIWKELRMYSGVCGGQRSSGGIRSCHHQHYYLLAVFLFFFSSQSYPPSYVAIWTAHCPKDPSRLPPVGFYRALGSAVAYLPVFDHNSFCPLAFRNGGRQRVSKGVLYRHSNRRIFRQRRR